MSNREAPTINEAKPETSEPKRGLIDALYLEEVLRARAMPPAEKVLAGPRLFEAACRVTLAGIKQQFPDASDEEHRRILRERLKLQRKLEASS